MAANEKEIEAQTAIAQRNNELELAKSKLKAEADKAAAQKQLKASYLGRIMIMAFAVVTGVLIPWFHYIAVLVPFLAPQPIMMIRRAVRSARARRDDTEKKGES